MLLGIFASRPSMQVLPEPSSHLGYFGTLRLLYARRTSRQYFIQGIHVGLGDRFPALASLAIIPLYYSRKHMTPTGIAARPPIV